MADVQTTDINTKPAVTDIDSNDQIFISDGGTALKKISYTNLAKAIIEQYNASQLAGATKTIQTAINDLNSNSYLLSTGVVIVSGADLNNYTTAGTYYVSTNAIANSISNLPVSKAGKLIVEQIGAALIQKYMPYDGTLTYIRRTGSTWSGIPWELQPTRAEMVKKLRVAYNNVTISANSYVLLDNYSERDFNYASLIGAVDNARNFGGIISFQFSDGGVYVYCTQAVSNGNLTVTYSYI